MTSDRKKPSADFWITVALVAVLVAYPLSWGPACWIEWSIDVPEQVQPIRSAAWWIYKPCRVLYSDGPQWYREYIHFCIQNGLDRPSDV